MQLNAKTTEDELRKAFKVFGPVVGCTVMWKTHCAYIDFEEAESATRARRAMNGAFLCGSALRVEFKVSSWEGRNNTWLLIQLTKGVVFSFLFFLQGEQSPSRSGRLMQCPTTKSGCAAALRICCPCCMCVKYAAAVMIGCRCAPALLCIGKS